MSPVGCCEARMRALAPLLSKVGLALEPLPHVKTYKARAISSFIISFVPP